MTEGFRLSVSKAKTYLDCKAKYKFNYILKLPKKDRDYFILGTFCHRVLEWFHQQYLDGNQDPYNVTITKAFKVAWEEYKEKMTPEMKKECWGITDKYLRLITKEKNNGLPANVINVEKRFNLNITENIVLNGAIDRIQLDADNVLHLADYKSTKDKKYLKNDWFQLLTYAFVMVSEDPSIKKIRASYILLRHDFEYLTKEFDIDEILSIKNKYIDYANQMLTEKEFPANPTFLCKFCDFTENCPEGKKMIEPSKIYGEVKW